MEAITGSAWVLPLLSGLTALFALAAARFKVLLSHESEKLPRWLTVGAGAVLDNPIFQEEMLKAAAAVEARFSAVKPIAGGEDVPDPSGVHPFAAVGIGTVRSVQKKNDLLSQVGAITDKLGHPTIPKHLSNLATELAVAELQKNLVKDGGVHITVKGLHLNISSRRSKSLLARLFLGLA